MSKPSSSRIIIRCFHHVSSKVSADAAPTSSGISNFLSNNSKTNQSSTFSTWISNSRKTYLPVSPNVPRIFEKLDPNAKLSPNRIFLGFRYISFKGYEVGSKNFAKNVIQNPVGAVRNTFLRYREAAGLHIEAFWKRNYLAILGAGGVVVCILLWRVLFGIASTFISLSEGMAKYGFLALSAAMVAFAGLYFRSRFTINPDKVYRMAMRRLNTSAGILEVMGAPLTGTDLRAYVMSGGGINLKNFQPRLRGKRCFLIFPIQGSERKGLVSVEVKKKKGQHDMKLLAVDIPMASGPDQRLFLIGNEEEYRIGGGLISELRDPVVKALAATKEFEDRDQLEDEEDAERELQEAERKHREEIEKLEKGDSQ
ncbi:uncharacterized protein LOC111406035 isoform X1 [Olea europaea var. sylvestris]|nr:uncharacterized protein LOC111406035 isoform X1 [Olea europaea var. sylvestris]